MEVAALLDALDNALPGFREYAESKANLYGTERVSSLWCCAVSFVQKHSVSSASWERLAELINGSVCSPDDELHNAVCSCFLEDVVPPNERDQRDHPLRSLLSGTALEYFIAWNGPYRKPQED